MEDKERIDYRNMLRLACNEFESLYRQHQFSDVTAKKLFYRICRVLAKHNKQINQQEDLMYWSRKDVADILEPIQSSELDMALSQISTLETQLQKAKDLVHLAADENERLKKELAKHEFRGNALVKYAIHHEGCSYEFSDKCNCGLFHLEFSPEPKKEGE